MHLIDMATRFPAVKVVSSASLSEAFIGFESSWISQFWMPDTVQGDKAFSYGEFKAFLDEQDVSFNLVPLQGHSHSPIGSKHRKIRSIFLDLKTAEPNVLFEIHAYLAITISNDLYGNNVMSSFPKVL